MIARSVCRQLNAVSNPDEFDINLLVTPGIVHGLHSKVSARAMNMVEERGDAFYVMDASIYGESISTMTSRVTTLDTNYAATYYPWVKIVDSGTSLPVWVPPSVVLPGVIAYTDQVSHEWFALPKKRCTIGLSPDRSTNLIARHVI